MNAPQEEHFELSEDLSRHLITTGKGGALDLIRGLASLAARARGNVLSIQGDQEKIEMVRRFLAVLNRRLSEGDSPDSQEVKSLFQECTRPDHPRAGSAGPAQTTGEPFGEILQTYSGRMVRARTKQQQAYVDALRDRDITIGIGPAGTGKTYLAVAMAVRALRNKEVSRVILSRPTIEAGEKLGYLPGDILEKVDPHFRPLYDALQEFLGITRFQQLLRQGNIEITPLAYMRGRTFNEAFIILDEAQNTTSPQMKMFLTRMGFGSRVVVTGDRTQIDLPRSKDSSLLELPQILGAIPRVGFVNLDERDVIRHELVREIIRAYEAFYSNRGSEA